jgi:hypothetical protein
MDEYKRVEKRTEVSEDPEGKVTNINVGPDSTAVVDENVDVEEERETERHEIEEDTAAANTIIRQEETIEKHQR